MESIINLKDVAWINGDEGQYANTNQKYALPTKEWQQFIEYNYQKQGTGKNLKEYNLPTKEDVKTKLNLPIKENINQPTQGEKIDWNEIERPEGKIRKHYKSSSINIKKVQAYHLQKNIIIEFIITSCLMLNQVKKLNMTIIKTLYNYIEISLMMMVHQMEYSI